MSLLKTPEKDENFKALDFSLKGIDEKAYTLSDVKGKNGTAIIFICNHCPYVLAIIDRLVKDCKKLQENGIGIAAIMPNDTNAYPEDSFENMKKFAKTHNFTFPYLIDETQETAKAYGAVCTPDIFGFNSDGFLKYRGRCDSAGYNDADENTKREFLEAMLEISEKGNTTIEQFPSMGCSIKWK